MTHHYFSKYVTCIIVEFRLEEDVMALLDGLLIFLCQPRLLNVIEGRQAVGQVQQSTLLIYDTIRLS